MGTEDIIVLVIILVILFFAAKGAAVHLKGEGECCGGKKEKTVRKRIKGKKTAEYVLHINGMHCVNCKNRIERKLDELDGVVAKVSLEDKSAKVLFYGTCEKIEEEGNLIKEIVEKMDFEVVGVQIKRL